MKYIRLFEEIENVKTISNLHYELALFLRKFETDEYHVISNFYERGEKNGVALAFQYKGKKWGPQTIFSIRITEVSDNKLKELLIKPKLKIKIDYYESVTRYVDDGFGFLLRDFISEIFKKYSYFNKFIKQYANKIGNFYINIKDIQNIVNELNENFELFISTKKYNL